MGTVLFFLLDFRSAYSQSLEKKENRPHFFYIAYQELFMAAEEKGEGF